MPSFICDSIRTAAELPSPKLSLLAAGSAGAGSESRSDQGVQRCPEGPVSFVMAVMGGGAVRRPRGDVVAGGRGGRLTGAVLECCREPREFAQLITVAPGLAIVLGAE